MESKVKQIYVVGNWKSHKKIEEAVDWFELFEELLRLRLASFELKRDTLRIQISVAVPYPFLDRLQQILKASPVLHKSGVTLSVQDISPFPAGKYTGAVSVRNIDTYITNKMLRFAIVGHSERRQYFHETNQDVAAKVAQALDVGMVPIVCVDDPYLEDLAHTIESHQRSRVIVAYEALETIGTGKSLDADDFIKAKEKVTAAFGQVPVLYGGSVTDQNAREYLHYADGYLIGGASLRADDFMAIVDTLCGE